MLKVRLAPWLLLVSCGFFPLSASARSALAPEPPHASTLLGNGEPSLIGAGPGSERDLPVHLVTPPSAQEESARVLSLLALANLLPAEGVQSEAPTQPPPLVPAPETGVMPPPAYPPGTEAPAPEKAAPPAPEQHKVEAPAPPQGAPAPPSVESRAQREARHAYQDQRVAVSTLVGVLGALVGGGGGGFLGFQIGYGVFMGLGVGGGPIVGLLLGAPLFILIFAAGIVVGGILGALLGALLVNLFYPPMKPLPPSALSEAPEPEPEPGQPPETRGRSPAPPPLENPRNNLNVSPLQFAWGRLSFEYERVLNDNLTVFASPVVQMSANLSTFQGGGGNGGVRWFFQGDAPRGFFLQGHSLYDFGNYGTLVVPSQLHRNVGVGAAFGYSMVLGRVFYLSLGLGLSEEYSLVYRSFSTTPVVRGNFGFAF